MDTLFADRIHDVPRSFIREILKVALDSSVISFAGGLPSRDFFPVEELREATEKVFAARGADIFQYSNSEGLGELREYIASRYKTKLGLDVPAERILITSGSQQGLDLLGKTILNRGDRLVIEEPGYLGAIQAFSIYRPQFLPVPVSGDGMDVRKLREAILPEDPKLMYTVPNFQNPSGISYPGKNREEVAGILAGTGTLLIEDDPYGDLRFSGSPEPSFYNLLPEQTILLGSFSKIVVPGFRLGWIVAPRKVLERLVTAKQATDLHTSHFTQWILYQYLKDYDIDDHIRTIVHAYGSQCRAMQRSIKQYFSKDVSCTTPEGGMFLWARLPENMSSLKLFEVASRKKVVFVPGDPFYINRKDMNTLRLNFSCVDEQTINVGIKRLGAAIEQLMHA
jgi:2-aminoadipate transaminase